MCGRRGTRAPERHPQAERREGVEPTPAGDPERHKAAVWRNLPLLIQDQEQIGNRSAPELREQIKVDLIEFSSCWLVDADEEPDRVPAEEFRAKCLCDVTNSWRQKTSV